MERVCHWTKIAGMYCADTTGSLLAVHKLFLCFVKSSAVIGEVRGWLGWVVLKVLSVLTLYVGLSLPQIKQYTYYYLCILS